MSRSIHDLPKSESASRGATPNSHRPSPHTIRSPHSDSPMSVSRKDSSLSSSKVGDGTPLSAGDQSQSEMSRPAKPSRSSQKLPMRLPLLFSHEPDRYIEATSSFSVIEDCIYANKYLGITEPALECDCTEEWDSKTQVNRSCGQDSDCINRATKMECIDDCSCGINCQNQRFQRKEFAKVAVIKTEKKGYGLRAEHDLRPHDFIFEYIGEVIQEQSFRRRMRQYDDEGIKHFYFMSLSKGEFIDATKKGNLGRFCNHSCNPNCYVDKWVVGDRLRMGIFAERDIKAGEELVFNYNVDRYGADPQPCYCGEPNCTGFIGGKTQTETGPKLSNATIEALGIDDYDGWDFVAPTRPKKPRKTEENDEDYVNKAQPKTLEEDGVTKVMATLMQCKEKWIAVKLLSRIQKAYDERVMHRVVRMHGYRILKAALSTFIDDANVCLQVLDILFKLPRITRNKIQDSGIEDVVQKLNNSDDERVVKQSGEIVEIWNQLEVAYRIPKVKRDPTAAGIARERGLDRRELRARSKSPPKAPAAPTGPKSNVPQRNPNFGGPSRGGLQFRAPRNFNALPAGWFSNTSNGRLYYYTVTGQTQWTRPTEPATKPPPAPPKEDSMTHEQRLQAIINSVTKATPKVDSPSTPASASTSKAHTGAERKEEKWRNYSEEKQKKIYENTLFPSIKYVIDKYKHKLPRDDLKRFGKEISKKLVSSDYKKGRVSDPTQISAKQEKAVKKYVKEFFDKAVIKHREHEKRKREKEAAAMKDGQSNGIAGSTISDVSYENQDETISPAAVEDEVKLTDDEISDEEDAQESKKRKEVDQEVDAINKRVRMGEEDISIETPPPPPPPPPPPADDDDLAVNMEAEDVGSGNDGQNGFHLDPDHEMGDGEQDEDDGLSHELHDRRTMVNGV